jgi:AraC-like DNA-binding protein
MKIQLEKITPATGSSFRWLINPKLNDFFFWHFHPEYELVFIEAEEGTRHVGEHFSRYFGSDLVLIGPYIPHLNFDYGVKSAYEKTVLHLQTGFLSPILGHTPELQAIAGLLEKSKLGIAFGEKTRQQWGDFFKTIHQMPHFAQFTAVLQLLNALAGAQDQTYLHRMAPKNKFNKKEQDRLSELYNFIDEHYQRKISLKEVADLCNLSSGAFCRYFRKMTKLSFTEFLNYYRINEAKRLLLAGNNVSEACFACGFESLSYFNRSFKKITGQNPMAFRKGFEELN